MELTVKPITNARNVEIYNVDNVSYYTKEDHILMDKSSYVIYFDQYAHTGTMASSQEVPFSVMPSPNCIWANSQMATLLTLRKQRIAHLQERFIVQNDLAEITSDIQPIFNDSVLLDAVIIAIDKEIAKIENRQKNAA